MAEYDEMKNQVDSVFRSLGVDPDGELKKQKTHLGKIPNAEAGGCGVCGKRPGDAQRPSDMVFSINLRVPGRDAQYVWCVNCAAVVIAMIHQQACNITKHLFHKWLEEQDRKGKNDGQ